MSDPGGFPQPSRAPRQRPHTVDEAMPGRGLEQTGQLDPWGEHGPADQAAADRPLDERQRDTLLAFPTYGDPALRLVDFTEAYARLVASAVAQLAFVDELVADAYRRHGVEGLVIEAQETVVVGSGAGAVTEVVPTGSQSLAALVAWQGQLQARVHAFLRDGIKIGIKAQQADLVRRYGEWVATAMQAFSDELGVDWDAQPTRRAAQRAVIKTRATLQLGVTSPDAAGPALTEDERVAIRSQARGG